METSGYDPEMCFYWCARTLFRILIGLTDFTINFVREISIKILFYVPRPLHLKEPNL